MIQNFNNVACLFVDRITLRLCVCLYCLVCHIGVFILFYFSLITHNASLYDRLSSRSRIRLLFLSLSLWFAID